MKQLLGLATITLMVCMIISSISCSDKPTQSEAPKNYKIAFTISPDGDNSNIYTIDPDGTDLAQLTNVTSARSADHPIWSPDGNYIYYKDFLDQLNDIFRMDSDGGNTINLTNFSGLDRLCDISPDGTKMLLISERSPGVNDLFVMNLDSYVLTNITNGQVRVGDVARFTPNGQKLVFPVANGDTYDIHVANIDGSSEVVMSNFGTSLRRMEISPNGQKLVYESRALGSDLADIWTCNIDGSNRIKISHSNFNNMLASWSPDSKKITYSELDGSNVSDIIIVNSDGTDRTNITNSTASEFMSAWSPNGSKIAYILKQEPVSNLYIMNPDGTDKTALSNNLTSGYVHEISWSPGL